MKLVSIGVSYGPAKELGQVSRHVSNSLQVTDLILQLKDLVQLYLLHLSYLSSHLQIGCLVLPIGRVREDIVQLHHGLLKGLDLHVLGLVHHEQVVQLLHQVVHLAVQVGEARVFSVQLRFSRIFVSMELLMDILD